MSDPRPMSGPRPMSAPRPMMSPAPMSAPRPDEPAGTHSQEPKIRVLTPEGQMITLDTWRTEKRLLYAN